jgi:hypothetical protein
MLLHQLRPNNRTIHLSLPMELANQSLKTITQADTERHQDVIGATLIQGHDAMETKVDSVELLARKAVTGGLNAVNIGEDYVMEFGGEAEDCGD